MHLHILKFVVSFHLGGGQDIEGISILWTNSVTRRGRAARRIGIDASSWRASILWDSPPPSRWSWRPATNWRTCCSVSAAWSWVSSSSLSSKSSWRLLDCTRHKSGRGLRVTSVERTKRTSVICKLAAPFWWLPCSFLAFFWIQLGRPWPKRSRNFSSGKGQNT